MTWAAERSRYMPPPAFVAPFAAMMLCSMAGDDHLQKMPPPWYPVLRAIRLWEIRGDESTAAELS